MRGRLGNALEQVDTKLAGVGMLWFGTVPKSVFGRHAAKSYQ